MLCLHVLCHPRCHNRRVGASYGDSSRICNAGCLDTFWRQNGIQNELRWHSVVNGSERFTTQTIWRPHPSMLAARTLHLAEHSNLWQVYRVAEEETDAQRRRRKKNLAATDAVQLYDSTKGPFFHVDADLAKADFTIEFNAYAIVGYCACPCLCNLHVFTHLLLLLFSVLCYYA